MSLLQNEPSLPYENRGLFSDNFLAEHLSDLPEWDSADVATAFERCRDIYLESREALPELNEAQTEHEFIRPVLQRVLGWEFTVQRSRRYQGRLQIPDYALFLDTRAKREAQENPARDTWARAASVADAKYWGRSLDGKGSAERESLPELSNVNPSMQIISYLIATGCEWGYLTNGAVWRLYSTRARSRIDTYYEVDLEQILEDEDQEAFRYFYLFFRSAAFRPHPKVQATFLEQVFEGSVQYGTAVEKKLKDLVFDEVFIHLAEGFRADRFPDTDDLSDADLRTIYQGTLRLLYRLLFLLHAEARALLPVRDPQGYGAYSLTYRTRALASRVDKGASFSGVSDDVWSDLQSLFRILNRGDADLGVPTYNGGLFSPANAANHFLEESSVADKFLVPALDSLVRVDDPLTGDRRFVDYKNLSVEQLGSIYEGLLEFRLRQARETLRVVRADGHLEYRPLGDGENVDEVIEKGELYLESDPGERRSSGSYYTPRDIVRYIVEETLRPLLQERKERFSQAMRDLQEEDGQAAKRAAIDAILGIRICDPAMGSGHFLVQATDWLTEHLIPILNEFPENPVLGLIGDTRESIEREMAREGVVIDTDRLKDVNLLKRVIMKRCIYGVDINPMAVELAKVSLWLDSFTVGAPLSFLDHHLAVGNSVAGARIARVQEQLAAEGHQHLLFGQQFAGLLDATELMKTVSTHTDATVSEVEESARKYGEFTTATRPYRRLLDLWVSEHFDVEGANEAVEAWGEQILAPGEDSLDDGVRKLLHEAALQAERFRFFHWELEFPEVFIDLDTQRWRENPGFDVVFGNPPYLKAQKMSEEAPELRNALWGLFEPTDLLTGHWDLYVAFVVQALQVTKRHGRHSFILPNPILREKYGAELRRVRFLHRDTLESVLDFGEIRAFPGVSRQTIVYVLSVGDGDGAETGGGGDETEDDDRENGVETSIRRLVGAGGRQALEEIEEFRWEETHTLSPRHWRESYNSQIRTSPEFFRALPHLKHVEGRSVRIGEHRYVNYGAQVSSKERGAFEKDDVVSQVEGEGHEPFFEGGDVHRYLIDWQGRWLDYRPDEMYGPRAKELFEGPKIAVRVRTDENERIAAAYDGERWYCDHTVILIAPYNRLEETALRTDFADFERSEVDIEDNYILALLNSRLLSFYFQFRFATGALQGTYSDVWPENVRGLPLRAVTFTGSTREARAKWVREVMEQVEEALDSGDSTHVLTEIEARHESGSAATAGFLHDLLAAMAAKMGELQSELIRLHGALNPFKWLNSNVAAAPLSEVLSREIKYGELVEDADLGEVRHDIESLRLKREGTRWVLLAELKKRGGEGDESARWRNWQREEDGRTIAREWITAFRFDMEEERARYYEQALQVRGDFTHTRGLPGGHTRSTLEKLKQTTLPRFEPAADLTDLVELWDEIDKTETHAAHLDLLIDEVVYRLFDLEEDDRLFINQLLP